jgi:hypothetical protein
MSWTDYTHTLQACNKRQSPVWRAYLGSLPADATVSHTVRHSCVVPGVPLSYHWCMCRRTAVRLPWRLLFAVSGGPFPWLPTRQEPRTLPSQIWTGGLARVPDSWLHRFMASSLNCACPGRPAQVTPLLKFGPSVASVLQVPAVMVSDTLGGATRDEAGRSADRKCLSQRQRPMA